MKLMVLFTVLSVTSAISKKEIQQRKCNDIVVNGINYVQETMIDGLDAPYHLSLDYVANYLFFTYTGNDGVFVPSFIDLNTNEYGVIGNVREAFATSFDQDTRTVYIGGVDGIYEFDYNRKSAVKTNMTDRNIWQLYAKTDVYFTTFPDQEAFIYKDNELKQIEGIGNVKVIQISVDVENNIVYYNSSGLFCYKNDDKDTFYLGEHVVVGFSMDMNRNLYFSTPTGIYKMKNNCSRVEKIAHITGLFGMVAIDDSFIYATSSEIIKIRSVGSECIPELLIH